MKKNGVSRYTKPSGERMMKIFFLKLFNWDLRIKFASEVSRIGGKPVDGLHCLN